MSGGNQNHHHEVENGREGSAFIFAIGFRGFGISDEARWERWAYWWNVFGLDTPLRLSDDDKLQGKMGKIPHGGYP